MKQLHTLLGTFFGKAPTRPQEPQLLVSEALDGRWRYHLREVSSPLLALCGTKVMHTNVSLDAWGTKSHLNEHYCVECAALAGERLPRTLAAR